MRVWRHEGSEGERSGLVVVLPPSARGSAKQSADSILRWWSAASTLASVVVWWRVRRALQQYMLAREVSERRSSLQ